MLSPEATAPGKKSEFVLLKCSASSVQDLCVCGCKSLAGTDVIGATRALNACLVSTAPPFRKAREKTHAAPAASKGAAACARQAHLHPKGSWVGNCQDNAQPKHIYKRRTLNDTDAPAGGIAGRHHAKIPSTLPLLFRGGAPVRCSCSCTAKSGVGDPWLRDPWLALSIEVVVCRGRGQPESPKPHRRRRKARQRGGVESRRSGVVRIVKAKARN